MSLIVTSENPDIPEEVLAYAYTRADQYDETVVIYRKVLPPVVLCEPITYRYIATGVDSAKPSGFEAFTAIGPRSPVYDRLPARLGECC